MADQDQTQQGAGQGDDPMADLKNKIAAAQQQEEQSVHNNYQQEIEELKKAKEEAEAKSLRALADFQNARKRMEDEKASFVTFANQSLILRVLDIYENYHRLMTHKPTDLKADEWHKGLDLIDSQFKSFLDQQGVKEIEVIIGGQIDPNKQEAVMSGEGVSGVILEIFSPGYEMAGRVIKTAKVKVGGG
jgi:molecular chaperone GrpE